MATFLVLLWMFKPEHLIWQEEPGAIERMVEICAKRLSITGTFLIIFHGRTFEWYCRGRYILSDEVQNETKRSFSWFLLPNHHPESIEPRPSSVLCKISNNNINTCGLRKLLGAFNDYQKSLQQRWKEVGKNYSHKLAPWSLQLLLGRVC